MTGAGGGMGYESFKAMLPDLGKQYDLIVLDLDTTKNRSQFEERKKSGRRISSAGAGLV